MERKALIEAVRTQMPERRWQHTEGVMQTSIVLARRFGAEPERAELAAILHDVAKFWPVERMREAIVEENRYTDVLAYDKELWHAHAGAYAAGRDYDVRDPEVLDAIRYHTSGRERMSLLERVVWLADLIEPGRNFPGVEQIRTLAEHDLRGALIEGFDTTIAYLLAKKKRIYPLTVLARNDLMTEGG
ncbi:bis(5'-nucleosyl)-tetraphosphatase (symmetrical) YqeK [Paenibacillus sp. IB182496]|uniref:bis(5'-nucleosyl)-tetraphosphatase (symmetrical) n=1 Tax=Paenibacillus sabuli TaxID=2772509 RepID=A0A927BQP3_9BACL|nr:bis(5'-nucleosyl)-tetraphosphatase (symmetrical) YqeK [Paenibacillus sabuli]MBD2844492.1 bis(5'-nucleosyl)-tetraphosphatase (symmetrical) YqeK [Paenibacillus sabuli]